MSNLYSALTSNLCIYLNQMDPTIFYLGKKHPVPSMKLTQCINSFSCFIYCLMLTSLIVPTTLSFVDCEQNIEPGNRPTTSLYDFYLEKFSDSLSSPEQNQKHHALSTPRIERVRLDDAHAGFKQVFRRADIEPARVHRFLTPEADLYSPVFNLESLYSSPIYSDSLDLYQNDAQPTDALSYSDLIDPGSGNYENPSKSDESTNLLEESNIHSEFEQGYSSIVPTPVQAQTPLSFSPTQDVIGNENNQAPHLNRRLPRLAVTAGQVWKYFIPPDTFIDEDGDLRKLRSTIVRKNDSYSTANQNLSYLQPASIDFAQYYSWVQYDASSQLIYGLPTDDDVGRHELTLVVSDHFGATSQEIIEIHVRQHQSSRAFTHQFKINNILWEPERFPSIVDALGEMIKQISTRVFMDRAFENFIVHSYTIDDQANSTRGQDNRRTSFSLTWSNSSIPIYPCSIDQIETLFKSMVNTQFLAPDWSSDTKVAPRVPPSASMIRIMEPEFKPDSISISLLGSCDSRELFRNETLKDQDNNESMPRVKIKIGVLSWKLGQPIEYRIPLETFVSDRGTYNTRNLQLSLHTIDGLTLDKDSKYNFIDFDQETQTIFGLPFDQENHAGQRELLLTARHPKSGYLIREVFIINIEIQDLTTINNRAFQMSLYFYTRTRTFATQERLSLSNKIVLALGGDRQLGQMTVMNIAKYINRAQLLPVMQTNFEGEYADVSKISEQRAEVNQLDLKDAVYKYSWTNESIGYLGDCPVEVIKENILYSLEQSMLDYRQQQDSTIIRDKDEQQTNKSDSRRFFQRLRQYFEPELDLIHLRFEPLGACVNAMELHDVGDSDVADGIDRANELDIIIDDHELIHHPQNGILQTGVAPRLGDNEVSNEEYWSIVVLLVLVVTLIFVIIMFFMGMHTYKMNQDKRFEMQVKLAQARQNSMYLSSMILANLASPNDCGSAAVPSENRACNMYIVEDEDKSSRKPVILDNEKHLFQATNNSPRSMAVQLEGALVRSSSVKAGSSVALDSIGNGACGWKSYLSMSPSALLYAPMDARQRSMTLNRKCSAQRQLPAEVLNHSQSILTVASIAAPLPIIPQANVPMVYAPILPLLQSPNQAYNYSSLRRVNRSAYPGPLGKPNMIGTSPLIIEEQQVTNGTVQMDQRNLVNVNANGLEKAHQDKMIRMSSPSHSSSLSAATNSVISNPNYSPHR